MTNSIEGAMPPLPEPDYYLWEHKQGSAAPTLSSNTGPHPDYEVTALFAKETLAPLLARVAELQADAARYRWLKLQARPNEPHDLLQKMREAHALLKAYEVFCTSWAGWDAAIDAALAANKEQQP